MAKIGVVLSGSGAFDGSELHEAVLTLLYLDQKGAEVVMMAPNTDQLHVVNHLTGDVSDGEVRNVLVESARIARGQITDLKDATAADFDALVFPGGFGAAKNLTTFAVAGPECDINPEVKRIISETVKAGKPLAAICIAPVLVAKALEGTGISIALTIGNDEGVAGAINSLGASHMDCQVKETIVDKENKIVTSPAYMLGQSISEVAVGVEATVEALFDLL